MEVVHVISDLRQSFGDEKIKMEKDPATTTVTHAYSRLIPLASVGREVATVRLTYLFMKDNRDRFVTAIHTDLGKPKVQIEVLEILAVANDLSSLG
jgi:hypothetical protein